MDSKIFDISNDNNMNESTDDNDKETPSYHDEFIDLSYNGIKINKYYYPLSKQKEIKIHNIKKIDLIELDRLNGKYTFYGFCWKFYYYHLDRKRPNKTHGILIEDKDTYFTIGITPNDPQKCFEVLKYLVSHMNGDTETEALLSNKNSINSYKEKID